VTDPESGATHSSEWRVSRSLTSKTPRRPSAPLAVERRSTVGQTALAANESRDRIAHGLCEVQRRSARASKGNQKPMEEEDSGNHAARQGPGFGPPHGGKPRGRARSRRESAAVQQPAERNVEGAANAVNIGSPEPEVMRARCAGDGFFGGCVAQRGMRSSSEVGSARVGLDGTRRSFGQSVTTGREAKTAGNDANLVR
jgi:hypothetical protein